MPVFYFRFLYLLYLLLQSISQCEDHKYITSVSLNLKIGCSAWVTSSCMDTIAMLLWITVHTVKPVTFSCLLSCEFCCQLKNASIGFFLNIITSENTLKSTNFNGSYMTETFMNSTNIKGSDNLLFCMFILGKWPCPAYLLIHV